jgi:hypothetical protein
VPLPLPLEPLVIVIHEPDRVAVHEHPLATVTVTEPVALGGLKPWLVGVTVKVHDPFCVTVKLAEPTVMVADRVADPELAATL